MATPATELPRVPVDEVERLAAVRRSGVREGGSEAALDGLVELAARLCGTSSAEINLVDETDLWFCAARGMARSGDTVARELTFCTWTVLDPDRPMLVPDARQDDRFRENPFVSDGIVGSYAGFPLVAEGQPIGTMCVHSPGPHELSDEQLESLRVLAHAAQAHLALRRHVEELSALARTDALTGAVNRRAFDETLERELAQATRRDSPASLLLIDLDHFKRYNDTHGHQGGDLLLQRAVRTWRGLLRTGDLLGRWGGEEFCVVLPDCPERCAIVVADRLRLAMPEGQTCSIGVATAAAGESRDALVGRADLALYAAKHEGRDRVVAAAATS